MSSDNSNKITVQLGDINASNVRQLRLLNVSTLPVVYSNQFYKDILIKNPQEYLKFAFCNGFAIGGLCARIEPIEGGGSKLYIMTLGVFAQYRRRGVAGTLLTYALDEAKKNPELKEVYLHVQVNNDEAVAFYTHHGFERSDVIVNYYKRIEPADCYLLRKEL